MAKALTRKGRRGSYNSEASSIENKNRNVVKATIFGGNSPVQKNLESRALPQEDANKLSTKGNYIAPPLDQLVLTMMEENSSELKQIFDAMEINIEGFGGRLVLKQIDDDVKEDKKAEIKKERRMLSRFLSLFHPEEDMTSFRKKTRRQMEQTGNGYWELIPPKSDINGISAMNLVEAHTVYITKSDRTSTAYTKKVTDPTTGDTVKKTFRKRFRRFIQERNGKKVWFKEWCDPRIVSRLDGKAYKTEAAAKKAGVKSSEYAHKLYQFKLWTARTPYGIPRYIGNLFSIFGSRASEEINYNTFLNNNVPSMAILVSGNAMLTDGTINRINEFTNSVMKRSNNYSKFLLIEAEPASEGIQNSGTAKIEIQPLKNEQQGDQLFQNYDKNNASKLRRAFRLPPIFVGASENYNRGTAETSRRLAEEQVFNPERQEMDRQVNLILRDMGSVYWEYKSYSPNVTDADSLIKLSNSLEKTGALTPNLVRQIISTIINTEIPQYKTDRVNFDPDVPFSLTMAEAVKQLSNLAGNPSTGALAPQQGQIPNNTDERKPAEDDPNTPEIEKRLDGLPVDESNDLDLTKLVDAFSILDRVLNKSADWRNDVEIES